MIGIVLKGHDYKYEVSELVKLFTSDFKFLDDLYKRNIFEKVSMGLALFPITTLFRIASPICQIKYGTNSEKNLFLIFST